MNRLSHLTSSEKLCGCCAMLILFPVFRLFYHAASTFPEVTRCIVTECEENSMQLGNEEVQLSFRCAIEKSNCSHDCHLTSRVLTKDEIKELLRDKSDCKYIKEYPYLGKEVFFDREKHDTFFGIIVIAMYPVLVLVYLIGVNGIREQEINLELGKLD